LPNFSKRELLAGVETAPVAGAVTIKAKRGRPKGSGTKAPAKAVKVTAKAAKRTLSPAGRKAIADAMKKRWAERKKAQG
jgi:hypothetical protein